METETLRGGRHALSLVEVCSRLSLRQNYQLLLDILFKPRLA